MAYYANLRVHNCSSGFGPRKRLVQFDLSDIVFLVVVLSIAVLLINSSGGGGGHRSRVPVGA